ncbi:MAG: acylphosphatase [Deltaproteobacteria bacterium]|nr:acylphosphatase [Deltaproteobacteria bacterium]
MIDIRVRLIIEGRVQGVWFRDSTRTEARRLGVRGWVKNLPDGNVEALAEGPEDKVEEFIRYCRQGPPHARVTHVDEIREEWTGEFVSFNIVF